MTQGHVSQLWSSVCSRLRGQMEEGAYDTWIAPIEAKEVEEGTLKLLAPSSFFRNKIEDNYLPRIREAIQSLDESVGRVIVEADGGVTEQRTAPKREGRPSYLRVVSRDDAAAQPTGSPDFLTSMPLNDRMRFETFIVGRPNKYAYGAAEKVAEDPGDAFNPLFIFGAPGLGKTHLAHAIARRRQERDPEARVLCISAESFLMGFIAALRRKETFDFKSMLRNVDMLVIDDLRHIVGKTHTEAEFLNTFTALVDQGKQVVVTSDRPVDALDGIGDRLRSRLRSGLVVEVHATDYELRRKILETRAEEAERTTPGLRIERKALDFLAGRLASDVRAINGALKRLVAFSSLDGRPVTIDLAQRELAEELRQNDRRKSIDEIQRVVSSYFGIPLSEMWSERRARVVARPRQIAMFFSKELTQKSLPEIGKKFGDRDHTTVMHAIKRVNELRTTDSAFDDDLERLRRSLESGHQRED